MCSCCILADWNLFSSAFSWRRWQPEPVDLEMVDLEMVDLESEEMEMEEAEDMEAEEKEPATCNA